jgi:hypothetical protein
VSPQFRQGVLDAALAAFQEIDLVGALMADLDEANRNRHFQPVRRTEAQFRAAKSVAEGWNRDKTDVVLR